MQRQSGWKSKSKEEIKTIYAFSEGYKDFLDKAKTEREGVRYITSALTGSGFDLDPSQDRVFAVNRNKNVMAFVRGQSDIVEGLNIIVAHIDAPRLDLKPNPLYEDVDLALLRTHYYGGIKKYQWVASPLAIHGIVIRGDGTSFDISIGEDADDPVFMIDDLLPHLSRKTQDEKKLGDAIDGEKLVVLFGSLPLTGTEKEPVKNYILQMLGDKYGMTEDDFVTAELEIVPAFRARDVGLDRSMVGGYGQDDRVAVYTLLQAIRGIENPKRHCLAIFTDKEEIGSEGSSSIKSFFLQVFLDDIVNGLGLTTDESMLRKMLFYSRAISADVNGAVNPTFQDVHEKQNAAYLGRGPCVSKYTGHMGKVGASDANAEYIAEITRLFNGSGIIWQTGELGKIDEGGGGTVAKHLAVYGMDIIDCGPALLTMHSPYELSNKLDIYETYRAFNVFFAS
ncbi:MAG: aminopeptidase [Syntrophorhabdaceae bacterium]